MKFQILPGEHWWGGCIRSAEKMPFDDTTVYSIDLLRGKLTQTAPLFLSDAGRYLWSEEPYVIRFDRGEVTAEGEAEIVLEKGGDTLREAYFTAMRKYFPFEPGIRTARRFYSVPQFNTWMELTKFQNEKDILAYAEEVVASGYTPGVLMIDGSWQKAQGVWEFNPDRFTDPKGMIRRLHEMGFTVMLWVSPFVCAEGPVFQELRASRQGAEGTGEVAARNHLVRNENGEVAILKWWSGFSATYNYNLPDDCAHMDAQLRRLMDEYGADGFKFDGGEYLPQSFLNLKSVWGGWSFAQLNEAWWRYGSKYEYHEYKDTWKSGGKPVIQRLFDKDHRWVGNGLDCLIPHGLFAGLIGIPFLCPDMVGSGQWTALLYGKVDEELFIRSAECSALFPMMQFSALPSRRLSAEGQRICLAMAKLHEAMWPEIEPLLEHAEQTGEPIIRSLEFVFPHCGYEAIRDEFLLGDGILVAPVVTQGAREREVVFPAGDWRAQDGRVYHGPCKETVAAPLDVLPWFRLVK